MVISRMMWIILLVERRGFGHVVLNARRGCPHGVETYPGRYTFHTIGTTTHYLTSQSTMADERGSNLRAVIPHSEQFFMRSLHAAGATVPDQEPTRNVGVAASFDGNVSVSYMCYFAEPSMIP